MDKKEMRNLFDGDCSPAEEQAAGRWLAEHAETKEADELLYALLRETKPATANAEGAFRRVCRRLGIAPKSSAWRLVGRWTMRAAACLLLPVAALAFYLYGEAQRPGEWFEAYAPYGKTLRVVLPDGSEVVINSGSKLIYPDRFGPDRRQVFLAGEGYATIAKDPGRPFVMSAGEVDVRVLGTKFNVVAVDCGIKLNIIRSLNARGCNVTVVPFDTDAESVLAMKPDGVFLSNGPGDPEDVTEVITLVKALRGKLPIFGR